MTSRGPERPILATLVRASALRQLENIANDPASPLAPRRSHASPSPGQGASTRFSSSAMGACPAILRCCCERSRKTSSSAARGLSTASHELPPWCSSRSDAVALSDRRACAFPSPISDPCRRMFSAPWRASWSITNNTGRPCSCNASQDSTAPLRSPTRCFERSTDSVTMRRSPASVSRPGRDATSRRGRGIRRWRPLAPGATQGRGNSR